MARGNWDPNIIKPRAKCRLCGYSVGPKDFVRLEGIFPAHRACATYSGRDFTEGTEVHPKPKQPEDITEAKSPGSRNEFAKKAKKAKIPMQMDNKDYGKKTTAVARTYDIIAQGDGHKFYGTRTIMTKEHKTFIQELLAEANDDLTLLPDTVIKELRNLIRKGAQDVAQKWKDALELVNKAYTVSSVRQPAPDQKGAWKQYMDLLSFGVAQLRSTRGAAGSWRHTEPIYTEAAEVPEDTPIGAHRFFVTVPGQAAQEIKDVDTMDDVIEMITNKINRSPDVIGTKVRVELRTKDMAKLGVYVNDVKREEVRIQDIS